MCGCVFNYVCVFVVSFTCQNLTVLVCLSTAWNAQLSYCIFLGSLPKPPPPSHLPTSLQQLSGKTCSQIPTSLRHPSALPSLPCPLKTIAFFRTDPLPFNRAPLHLQIRFLLRPPLQPFSTQNSFSTSPPATTATVTNVDQDSSTQSTPIITKPSLLLLSKTTVHNPVSQR